MADRNLELALRIRTLVQGAENVDDLRQEMGGLADELEQTGEEAKKAGQQFDDLEQSERKAGEGADDTAKGMQGLHGAVGDLVGKLGEMVAVTVVAERFISANEEARKLGLQFRAMTGDTEKASEELNYIREVANRWGVAVNDLSPAYLRLAAATKGSRAEGEATRQMIDDLSAAYMNAGAAADDIEESMEILGERFAEGTVSIADLKEGMQEDMPPAIQAATTAVLENDEALKKMLETGSAAAEDFMPAFAAALRQHIGGSQDKIESMEAAFVRMGASIDEMMVSINDKIPVMDLLVGTLNTAAQSVGVVTQTISSGITLIADGFTFVGEAVGTAAGALAQGDDALAAVAAQGEQTQDSLAKTALHLFGLKTAAERAAETQAQLEKNLKQAREEADPYQAAIEKINHRLEDAQREFQNTADAAKLTETALEEFFKAPERNLNSKGVMELAATLQIVAQNAKGAGDQIASTLGAQLAKLTNEQLVKLEEQARKAMAAAGGSEEARKAFADLGQVIEGVVLARFERLGVDGKEALTGISDAASDAIDDFTALASNAELSANAIEKAFEGALAKLDSPEELKKLKQKIIELGQSGKLTGDQVANAMAEIDQRMSEVGKNPALEAAVRRLEKVADASKNYTSALEKVADAQLDGIRADRDKATALGETAIAQMKAVELAKAEAEWAKVVAAAKQVEIAAEQALLQAKIAQKQAAGLKTEADKQEYAGLQLKNAALGMESDAVKKSAEAKDIAAKQTGQTTQATQQSTEATQADTSAQEKNTDAKKSGGSVAKILADALAYAREQTKALSDATGVLFEKLYSKRLGAEGIADTGLQKYIVSLEQAPPKFAAVTQKIGQLNAAIAEGERQYLYASNFAGRFLANLQISSAQAQKAWYEQKLQADILTDSLQNLGTSGSQNMALIAQATRAAGGELAMLDEEDLSGLQSALDEAKQKLQELQDETISATDRVAELNAELAREQGDTDTADQLELELAKRQALAEVETNLAKARAANNRDLIALYEAQLAKEQQLYDLKEKNLKRDQEEARRSNRTETTTHTTTTSGSVGMGSATINVNVNAGNARLLDSRFKEELARDLKPIFDDLHRRLQ